MGKLKDTQIKALKPKEKQYTVSDGDGLQLLIKPNGSKLFRFRYRYGNKQKVYSIGKYPIISLADARAKTLELKKIVADGNDPMELKKEAKKEQIKRYTQKQNTFEKVALERLAKVEEEISESHYKRTLRGFNNDVFPFIGDIGIDDIEPHHIIEILKAMSVRNVKDASYKVYQSINRTFKWAVANRIAKRNPASDIDAKEIIGTHITKHYATIVDDRGIKNLLELIDSYTGHTSTRLALLFLARTFVRPTNVRLAKWSEIDFDKKQWIIPAKKMKTKGEFIVPLSNQAIQILKEAEQYSGDELVFPSTKSKTTPLSEGALIGCVRRIGYSKDEFVPHGFRAMFSTIAHEKSSFSFEVIETQLAHSVGNSVSQAYNRAKYIDDRTELMQWWSDHLDEVCR